MSRNNILLIFFAKYLVISKKSSTFALGFGVKSIETFGTLKHLY